MFTLLFDTGSSWTWVPDKNFEITEQSNSNLNFKKRFIKEDSKTFTCDKKETFIKYGQGYIEGNISYDTCRVSLDKNL